MKQGIHTSTAVLPVDNPVNHEEFVSEYPGTSDMDPFWAENVKFFKAWWQNPLKARDQIFTTTADDDCQAGFGPIHGALVEEFNDCKSQQVCG